MLSDHHYFRWPYYVPACSLRIGTLNVNGALHSMISTTSEILAHLLDAAQLSILGITDARTPLDGDHCLKTQFHHSLPQGTAVINFCTTRPHSQSTRNCTMGGQAFLIHRQWEKWVGHHRSDSSGLALIVSIRVTYNRSTLSIIQVMVPPRSTGPYTMWTRLSSYLRTIRSPITPEEYVMHTADSWATTDRLAGRGVVIMGDFNKSLSALNQWAALNSLDSLSDKLRQPKPDGISYSSFNGSSASRPSLIDHIFLQTHEQFDLTSVGGTMHPLFSEVADHNPIWAGIQWPPASRTRPGHGHPDLCLPGPPSISNTHHPQSWQRQYL